MSFLFGRRKVRVRLICPSCARSSLSPKAGGARVRKGSKQQPSVEDVVSHAPSLSPSLSSHPPTPQQAAADGEEPAVYKRASLGEKNRFYFNEEVRSRAGCL
jgi:hypothetical protein